MKKLILFAFSLISTWAFAQTLEDKWLLCTNVNCQILDSYYEDGAAFTWDGNIVDGKADGYGKAVRTINGEYHSTYEGMYSKGIREGKGKFSHKDGSVLECTFVNNQAMGEGKWIGEDGSVYEGNIINYRRHGMGKQELANGTTFEGFFVSDDPYDGVINKYDGTIIYVHQYAKVDEPYKEPANTYDPVIGKPVTEYFDKDWKRCEAKKASYYRRITYKAPNIPDGVVKDYYMSGQLQSDFYAVYLDYNDDNRTFHEGEAHWFFENGKPSEHRYYYNNKTNGCHTFYYESGQEYSIANYTMGVKNGEYYQYYPSGKLRIFAIYDNGDLVEDKYVELDENGVGSLVYKENFHKHKSMWESGDETNLSEVTEKGVLLTHNIKGYSCQRSTYISFDQTSDYVIEATISTDIPRKSKSEVEYGLLFGFKDWDNYYQFIINNTGQFYVNGEFEGVGVVLKGWTAANSSLNLSGGDNTLKVFKFGNQFTFAINGNNMGSVPAKDLRGNQFGITARTPGKYLLKELTVREYRSLSDPRDAYPSDYVPGGGTPSTSSTASWKASGTGFFINENGYIATNYHVIDGMKTIQVEYLQNGKKYTHSAEVVVSDPTNDLAILRITDNSFVRLPKIPYVFTAKTEDVGTEVFTLGYPKTQKLGDEIKFTDGKVSAKTGVQGDIRLYQISVPITHGNSGGPLFDSKGNLIGITSSGWDNENSINYAIKSIYLKNLIDVLPESITLPNDTSIADKSLTEKVKILSDFVPFILVK